MRIGVLASGSGTILAAILEAAIPVAVVVVDRPCRATDVAAGHGVPAVLVERQSYGKDIAQACVFLGSDRSAQVTGIVLPVDAGSTCGDPQSLIQEITEARAAALAD